MPAPLTIERAADRPDPIYKGYLLAPARTPGKVRVLNADASIAVPLSFAIFDSQANACRAIRAHLARQRRH